MPTVVSSIYHTTKLSVFYKPATRVNAS